MSQSSEPSEKIRPKVIAAIPCLNTERFIGNVVARTIKYVDQVIVIDDGSSDNSLHIINDFISENDIKSWKVISTENRGLSSARNTGLDISDGDYIYFLDSDDYLESEAV